MPQSLANVLLHIVFSTKNRHPFIDEKIESELYSYLVTTANSHGSYVYKIGGFYDHVHILTTLPRTISISNLIEELKKNSSKWIKTKDHIYEKFSWQNGYGIFSVSESLRSSVENYISNQKEHHRHVSFQEEYRKLLNLNKIVFDENYVWD